MPECKITERKKKCSKTKGKDIIEYKISEGSRMSRFEKVIECMKRYKPEKIIAFGSYVRNEVDEYSDFDFVVIKKTGKRFIERLIELAKLIDIDLGKVDVFVYTPWEFQKMIEDGNAFIEQVLNEGIVVYEKKQGRSNRMVKAGRILP
jgi:predicted nucleotidyltransferase